MPSSILLYQVKELRKLEELAMQSGISVDILMERAGRAAFGKLQEHWPKVKNITIVCGKGNNGGDGYVVARLAKLAKLKVKILKLGSDEKLSVAARKALLKCRKLKINSQEFSAKALAGSEVVVDAILGIGVVGQLSPKFTQAINAINASKIPVLALDLPSGIDADTGEVLGVAIKADLTVTFIGYKIGLLIGEVRNYSGQIVCDELELTQDILSKASSSVELLNLAKEIKPLKERKPTANKGDFGHLLVVGGDDGMGGAVRMVGEAALRVGAGLVTVATRAEHIGSINAARPEIMAYGVHSGKQLLPLLSRATAVVIGPGLGSSRWSRELLQIVLASKLPLVVDADGLNILVAKHKFRSDWILTPHPGEAARLLATTAKKIQIDRLAAVKKIQHTFGGVAVLKGAGSLIAASGESIRLCDAGNPGMASGGMGDILSGIIGGLLVQGLNQFDAAKLGVLLHALAGDLVAMKEGQLGMLTLDLLPEVRMILSGAVRRQLHF